MRHDFIVLDGYCEKDRVFKFNNKPCKKYKGQLGAHCIGCDCFNYSETDNALVYANQEGLVESLDDRVQFNYFDLDTFDEDREHHEELEELWKQVCRKKIDEVIDEYLELKEQKVWK